MHNNAAKVLIDKYGHICIFMPKNFLNDKIVHFFRRMHIKLTKNTTELPKNINFCAFFFQILC